MRRNLRKGMICVSVVCALAIAGMLSYNACDCDANGSTGSLSERYAPPRLGLGKTVEPSKAPDKMSAAEKPVEAVEAAEKPSQSTSAEDEFVTKLTAKVAEISKKFGDFVASNNARVGMLEDQVGGHERRITTLEECVNCKKPRKAKKVKKGKQSKLAKKRKVRSVQPPMPLVVIEENLMVVAPEGTEVTFVKPPVEIDWTQWKVSELRR